MLCRSFRITLTPDGLRINNGFAELKSVPPKVFIQDGGTFCIENRRLYMHDVFSGALNTISGYLIEYFLRLAVAVVILLVGFKVSAFLSKRFLKLEKKEHVDEAAVSFIRSAVDIAFKTIVIVSAVAVVGIPMASIIAVIGSAGVAIGLAMQGSLSNIAGGVIILLTKPFKHGDFITFAGNAGTVNHVDLFYTSLITPDNKKILIPNGQLMNAQIENASSFEYRRIDMNFSAAYSCDIDKVKRIILETAIENPDVIKNNGEGVSAPFVAVKDQGDSAVVYLLRMWCKREKYWDITFNMNERMKKAFDDNGISIPFPQLDINVKESK